MPIYISDGSQPIFSTDGRMKPTMSAFSADMDGSSESAPADNDGFLQRAMGRFTARLQESTGGFPIRSQYRIGNRSYALNDATGVAERARIAKCDVVYIGLYRDGPWDNGDSNYLSRSRVVEVLKGLNPNLIIYDYVNVMETSLSGPNGLYCQSQVGPTGNGGTWTPNDWIARNSSGAPVVTFGSSVNTNITAYVTPDGQGRDYVDYYVEQIQASHIDPHISVGPAGINLFFDNCFYKARTGSRDLNRDGSNDGGRVNPLVEEEVAWRVGFRKAVDLIRANNPGILVAVNNSDWFDEDIPGAAMQVEYIGIGDGGSYEGPTRDSVPYSRVFDDGTINPVNFGSWALAQSGWVHCVDNVNIPAHESYMAIVDFADLTNITPSDPINVFRWTFCSALMENGGYHVSKSTGYNDTPELDEMGGVNGVLPIHWLGLAVDGPQRTALHDTLYGREFDNGFVFVNTSLTETTTVTCPGDIPVNTYKRITGVQDTTTNDGSIVSANFDIDPIDGILLERL